MSAESWKLTLPCTRAEAEAIDAGDGPAIDPMPVLTTSETAADETDSWRLDAYFEREPDPFAIAAIRALAPSATRAPLIERIADADWVTMSQAGLEPVRAGRFVVHTPAHPVAPEPGVRAFVIEAGRAFGTGHHETTTGCLVMLDAMARQGLAVESLIDLGTGTGLLAFAALHLWPAALATATDIDPVAIDVTRENAAINGMALGEGPGALALYVADGAADARIAARARYDLVIANILAAPLIAMAPDVAAIAGGEVLLAGLLGAQADAVIAAYRAAGLEPRERLDLGDWAILWLGQA